MRYGFVHKQKNSKRFDEETAYKVIFPYWKFRGMNIPPLGEGSNIDRLNQVRRNLPNVTGTLSVVANCLT
jgi:hypothetical protein